VSSSYNDEANTDPISGYGLLSLRTSWAASRELKFDLKLDNLLDRQYSRTHYNYQGASYGYREEGRTALFSVTWTPAL
jgi:vitamin B12 transporter